MHFIKYQLCSYIFIKNNNTKKKQKKKKEGKREFGRSRTRHPRLGATTPHHYTTETDYVTLGEIFLAVGLLNQFIAVHEYSMPDDSPVTCLSRDLLVQEHLWENNTKFNKESGRLDTNLSSELTAQKFRSLRVKIVCEREKHGVNILCATCISQVSQWDIWQLSQTSVSK